MFLHDNGDYMKKGFIGPLGDDLPSVVIIVLAMGLFFSGLLFAINTYNQKIVSLQVLRGSLDIGRVVTDEGIIVGDSLSILKAKADIVAKTSGLKFELYFADNQPGTKTGDCGSSWYKFNYLVAYLSSTSDIVLRTLVLCTGRF